MIDLLPRTIRDMVRLIGWPATIAFVRAFGGKRIYIPRGTESGCAAALAEVVGEDALGKLCRHFGDTRMNVPFCRGAMMQVRNVEIVHAYDAGTGLNELVDRYGISHRWLQIILKTTDTSLSSTLPFTGKGLGERGVGQRAFEF
jgi:Mor family transcriptional regulator